MKRKTIITVIVSGMLSVASLSAAAEVLEYDSQPRTELTSAGCGTAVEVMHRSQSIIVDLPAIDRSSGVLEGTG